MTSSIAARTSEGWIIGTVTDGENAGWDMQHGMPGAGVVVAQSYSAWAKVPVASNAFRHLKNGLTSNETLSRIRELHETNGDTTWGRGQILILGKDDAAVYTGPGCIDFASHVARGDVVAAANVAENTNVPNAMIEAWDQTIGLEPRERVIAALRAAEKSGGDVRGNHSAALMFVGRDPESEILVCFSNYHATDPIGELEELEPVPMSHPGIRPSLRSTAAVKVDDLVDNARYTAAEKLAKALINQADLPYRDVILLDQARIYAATGRHSEAAETLAELKKQYPGRHEFARRAGLLSDPRGAHLPMSEDQADKTLSLSALELTAPSPA